MCIILSDFSSVYFNTDPSILIILLSVLSYLFDWMLKNLIGFIWPIYCAFCFLKEKTSIYWVFRKSFIPFHSTAIVLTLKLISIALNFNPVIILFGCVIIIVFLASFYPLIYYCFYWTLIRILRKFIILLAKSIDYWSSLCSFCWHSFLKFWSSHFRFKVIFFAVGTFRLSWWPLSLYYEPCL